METAKVAIMAIQYKIKGVFWIEINFSHRLTVFALYGGIEYVLNALKEHILIRMAHVNKSILNAILGIHMMDFVYHAIKVINSIMELAL